MKYGMIAGNGRFPILALETASKAGDEVVVIAIKEEASPEKSQGAARFAKGDCSRRKARADQGGIRRGIHRWKREEGPSVASFLAPQSQPF